MRGGPGTGDPDRIIFTDVTLLNVVLRAYQVKSYQATAPDWMSQSASTWFCTTKPNNSWATSSSGVKTS
jgi:uncharacterized protein (TIGR03435 family)